MKRQYFQNVARLQVEWSPTDLVVGALYLLGESHEQGFRLRANPVIVERLFAL